MKRTYENALRLLETRRRKGRPKAAVTVSALNDTSVVTAGSQGLKGVPSLLGMTEWLKRLGYSESNINDLNIIHVTGTKGKGSTCAFTYSFLRAHGLRTGFPKKIGLYTSPDLQSIRERIQINHQPIAEDLFTKYFFEVWERLLNSDSAASGGVRQPRFLQLLTLIAFHTFIREGVEAAIFEVHHGGEYDITNVIQKPVATGITSLGMDHVAQLGPTIEDIAWHKAGIFKAKAPAFSTIQEAGSAQVMRSRAAEKGTTLTFVSYDSSLPVNARALSVPVQKLNCSLALALSSAFVQLKAPGNSINDDDISQGVENFLWPGRFEMIEDGHSEWFVDAAHNQLSMKQTVEWFAKNVNGPRTRKTRILIFSHSSGARDGATVVKYLEHALSENDVRPGHVIFTSCYERADGSSRIDKLLPVSQAYFPEYHAIYSTLWKSLDPQATISIEPTVEEALGLARRIGDKGGGMQTLATGCSQMVGGALSLLRPLNI